MSLRLVVVAAALLALTACSGEPAAPRPGSTSAPASSAPATGTPSVDDLDLYAGAAPAVAPRGTATVHTLQTADGRTRTYRLFVPAGGRGVAPLLLALHGGLGSGAQFATSSRFDGLATANTFLVAYPDGIGRLPDGGGGARTWNGGDCCGPAADRDVDDVAFLRAVVDDVARSYAVDPNRVYAAGHSNGGIMALRLACEASDLVAAVGVQSAALGVADCAPRVPVSLMQIHGTADTNVPIDGGRGSGLADVDFRPARDAAVALAASDGCTSTPTDRRDTANPDLQLTVWTGCEAGTAVELLTVAGANHAWMGAESGSRLVGAPYADLDSSRAIWSFLAAHPRS